MKIEYFYDIDKLKTIWRQYQIEFGRLYPNYLEEQTSRNRVLACKINDLLAGVVSYDIKPTKRLIVVDILATFPDFRGKHVATELLKAVYQETESLIFTLGYEIKAEAYEGLPNNTFWDKLSKRKEFHVSPSGKTRSYYYYLDLQKLLSM